jgi:translation initiation factor IF-1
MLRKASIEAEGRIKELLSGSVFRVEMPNGHCILAFLSRRMRPEGKNFSVGDRVQVEMWLSDFSKGRIVAKE